MEVPCIRRPREGSPSINAVTDEPGWKANSIFEQEHIGPQCVGAPSVG